METLAELFRAFGDPNRLRILNLLANRGEVCVCDFERVLEMPQSRISKHLTALRHAGLVQARREGTWMHYSLAEPVDDIHACQIDCLRCCFPKRAEFAADLETYDRKHREGALACAG